MVVIRDIKMPKRCIECKFCAWDGVWDCYICKLQNDAELDYSKAQSGIDKEVCPLVEIITCKDCKYYRKDDNTGHCTNHTCGDITFWCHDDYYCADAVRKDVANE